MCGIAAVCGPAARHAPVEAMVNVLHHRGPDGRGVDRCRTRLAALGHSRLSIIDLSDAGLQPMCSASGRFRIVFNGEIYNYLELREELQDYSYASQTDTEVILAAYERWGEACLHRFVGMFAFAIWDEHERTLFAARDRFGVKPLYYSEQPDGSLICASEIKALHAAGVPRDMDPMTWAAYLTWGISDYGPRTFWKGILSLQPGHCLTWRPDGLRVRQWYDLAARVGPDLDTRSDEAVIDEYLALLVDGVRLRFRSDVSVGINLSGGLDSSTLLGAVQLVQGADSDIKAFTYVTRHPQYDELPWVRLMLQHTQHPVEICELNPCEVPALAESLQACADEPFGGLPTIAYTKLFERARQVGVVVLLDGQGMDEQWAGYDYYAARPDAPVRLVQGTSDRPVRPECLIEEFRALASPVDVSAPFPDRLRNLQYRDTYYTKIPKALRFNDRASMRASTELREPFLDHRLFELALRQPASRKLRNGTHKWLLRELARKWLPTPVVEAPKRAVSTPQREWLRGPLQPWAEECIAEGLEAVDGRWLDGTRVWREWEAYKLGGTDNSFFVWQWISIGLMSRACLPSLSQTAEFQTSSVRAAIH